jgi:hypothetical protein
MKTIRSQIGEVMRRAALLDISDLSATEQLRGAGRRESVVESCTGLGRMKSISKWNSDYPYAAINWELSAQTSPRERLVIKREKNIYKYWCALIDCSLTMRNFGTKDEMKLLLAAQLVATFAQAAEKRRDPLTGIIFDEDGLGSNLENACPEDLVLLALSHKSTGSRHVVNVSDSINKRDATGLVLALSQLPENPAIVPIVSDFMHLTEEDKKELARAARYHSLLCCIVEDRREKGFPKGAGQVTLRDLTTGNRRTMSFARAHELVSQDRNRRFAELTAFFQSARIPYATFESGEDASQTRAGLIRLMQQSF